MASADFSQFVVTTANDSACETSPLKVRTLFPHLPATFTGTSGNFGASSLLADSPIFPSLICDSCPSGQGFAYSFLQIPPHDGHPCCSAMCFAVAYAHSGLSPVRACPWRANQKQRMLCCTASSAFLWLSFKFLFSFFSVFYLKIGELLSCLIYTSIFRFFTRIVLIQTMWLLFLFYYCFSFVSFRKSSSILIS